MEEDKSLIYSFKPDKDLGFQFSIFSCCGRPEIGREMEGKSVNFVPSSGIFDVVYVYEFLAFAILFREMAIRGCRCFVRVIVPVIFLLLFGSSSSLPLCTDSRAPFTPRSPLQFCPSNGRTCCNYADEQHLQKQYESINISNPGCASVVRSILCARCDQFSGELFRVNSAPRELPVLCNSTVSPNSPQSKQVATNFCSQVWNSCQNVSILNSPFAASLQGQAGAPTSSNSTKLTDIWKSQIDFCGALGGASDDGLLCFNGSPVILPDSEAPSSPSGMCIEKIANGSYLNMAGHPDGSNRAFFANQAGKIWLGTIPKRGSGGILELDEANPFLDLTDEVHFDVEFGMLGIAFHPRFTDNGRFFASFSCDKAKWPDCVGRCACNSDVNCDPSKLSPDNGAQPCQYQSVIAEFTVNGTASGPSSATRADPFEVRRLFTMGLPFTAHHGGQILFGPEDGYLYLMMGDGGGNGDPYNFAQNKKSLLGKILRFDVDNMPNGTEASDLGLWGNYSIPKDNPYTEDQYLEKEIWAMGLRNPWRCSFDSARPSYFICADVGQDQYEEVDLITKDGNYGWRAYEGPYLYSPPQSLGKNNSVQSIRLISPAMGYNHSEVNTKEGSASITGGYFYRSMTDPCMYGRYLFADLYAGAAWVGTENPINSGNFTSSKISFTCAQDSPLNCSFTPGKPFPDLGYIFSFGEDNNKDVYLLTYTGVYRIVRPSRCNYTCSRESESTEVSSPSAGAPPGSLASRLSSLYETLLVVVSFVFILTNFG